MIAAGKLDLPAKIWVDLCVAADASGEGQV